LSSQRRSFYVWKGTDGEEVDKALVELFGGSGVDLEEGMDGQLSFVPSKETQKKDEYEREGAAREKLA